MKSKSNILNKLELQMCCSKSIFTGSTSFLKPSYPFVRKLKKKKKEGGERERERGISIYNNEAADVMHLLKPIVYEKM